MSPLRKVWVRRVGASPTLVPFGDKDVVDEIREKLLRKYGNSLGRVYDAPDITLRLIPRDSRVGERYLGPDEVMDRVLEKYYPGGQSVDEALIIDVPLRRATPSSSPNGVYRDLRDARDLRELRDFRDFRDAREAREAARDSAEPRTDYFGPGAVASVPSSAASHHAHTYTYQRHAHTHVHQPNLHLQAPPAGGSASPGHAASPVVNTGGNGEKGSSGGGATGASSSLHNQPHSISVLSTGQVPTISSLPSPGLAWRPHKEPGSDRPKLSRQRSGSASVVGSKTGGGGVIFPAMDATTLQPPGPGTPQISVAAPIPVNAPVLLAGQDGSIVNSGLRVAGMVGDMNTINGMSPMGALGSTDSVTIPADGQDSSGGMSAVTAAAANGTMVASPPATRGSTAVMPRPSSPMHSKKSKNLSLHQQQQKLDDDQAAEEHVLPLTVPPINVLIVEDNTINLKLLVKFVKRLKVRWQTAMNGRDAVLKWRTGGFHLVLMDIQLPLMNGLEATREIRRLERVNSIGVFASKPGDSIGNGHDPRSDKLENMSLFKSPVIIVALTASSLQSDRNDALAAGCNDFMTKPVKFAWLQKKIMEWGCMQALIDFDGWRKWKELKLPMMLPDGNEPASSGDKKSKQLAGHAKRPPIVHEAGGGGGDSFSTITTLLHERDSSTPVPGPPSISSPVPASKSPLAMPFDPTVPVVTGPIIPEARRGSVAAATAAAASAAAAAHAASAPVTPAATAVSKIKAAALTNDRPSSVPPPVSSDTADTSTSS